MDLPTDVRTLLATERRCVLATSHRGMPHASLMNFTYLGAEGTIIMSAGADTRKVQNIRDNPRVALLVSEGIGDTAASMSCTLSGVARIVDPHCTDDYRRRHRDRHPGIAPFLDPQDTVIIAVEIAEATLADSRGGVRHWAPPPQT